MSEQTYYLQGDGERTILHTQHIDGCELQAKPIQAASWVQAKKDYGFDLTPLQASMLSTPTRPA